MPLAGSTRETAMTKKEKPVTRHEKIIWEYAHEETAIDVTLEVLRRMGSEGREAWHLERLEGGVQEIYFKRRAKAAENFNWDAF
jgi:hypothetical protein